MLTYPMHGEIVGVDFEANDAGPIVYVLVRPGTAVNKTKVVIEDPARWEDQREKYQEWLQGNDASPRLADVEWRHLDGTKCVAGFKGDTGLCAEGGGPVTPRITSGGEGDL